jgi:hypothetical protein
MSLMPAKEPKSPRTGKALKGKRDIAARYRMFVDAASTPDENGRFLSYTQAYIEAFDPDPERSLNDIGHDRCDWLKKHPEIEARVEKQRAEVRESLRREAMALPIAHQMARIAQKQALLDKLFKLIAERATDGRSSPTGLEVVDYKGKDADQLVLKFDSAVIAEIRALHDAAAKELGQIVEKADVTSGGHPIKALIGIDPADL